MSPIATTLRNWLLRARSWSSAAQTICSEALGSLYPERCLACGEETGMLARGLCASCVATFVPIAGRGCPRCGAARIERPGRKPARRCARCTHRRFAFRGVAAGLRYGAAVRATIHAIKFHHRPEGIAALSRFVERAIRERGLVRRVDVVVAVPLHPFRRFRRGFDQAELLGIAAARAIGRPFVSRALRRRFFSPARSLSRGRDRSPTLGDAFAPGFHARRIRGRKILLVDDVLTTGATADAAARALLAAGARTVHVAVAAT